MSPPHGRHSFLFWLILPGIMVWLTVGYITGILFDKPKWLTSASVSESENIVPYFTEHNDFTEDLDQPFLTFWFDDAWLSQYTLAYPILSKNDFLGTIAVPVNAIETSDYMNWAQLRNVQKNGWEINNHTLAHNCEMDEWDVEKVNFEFKNSKFILWKNGLTSDILVTPCGVDSKTMRQEAEKMFVAYRTVDPGYNDPKNVDFYNLKVRNIDNRTKLDEIYTWIDEAIENKYWVILVFHKVGEHPTTPTGDEFNVPIEDFRKIVDYVKESGIKVVTPTQIIASQK